MAKPAKLVALCEPSGNGGGPVSRIVIYDFSWLLQNAQADMPMFSVVPCSIRLASGPGL
ncbi:hypothetical protein [Desulfovibrio sp.]|uniref:hypothetical protein n=1 Tax=Desulfovibrio sp. TaxID=885 RepID=UPI00258F8421|nr:hypothetical protein [Desulfovibrio sp.]